MIRGRIVVIAQALSPIHHGGGTEGNVNQFRTHQVFHDGEKFPVPFISGNSIKGQSRRASAWFALAALGLDAEGGLSRKEVQLILSGGALTKSGASVRLDKAREAEALFPTLGLHGYSAGNSMQEAQLRVDFLELLCAETAHKYETEVNTYGTDDIRSASEKYASEHLEVYWGTRHEPTRRRSSRTLLTDHERQAVELEISDKKDAKNSDKGDSLQMMYEFECLAPGSFLIGGYTFAHGITAHELQAFRAGLHFASEGRGPNGGLIMRIGGKGSVDYGKCEMHFHGLLAEGIEPMRYIGTDELCPPMGEGDDYDSDLRSYIDYITENADATKAALEALA